MGKRTNLAGAAAVALGMVMVMGSPASAATQHLYCDFRQTGSALWRESKDVDGMFRVTWYWRNVHNDLYYAPNDGPWWWNGPSTLETVLPGNDAYAPFAIELHWGSDSLLLRGTGCRNNADANINAIDREQVGQFQVIAPPPRGIPVPLDVQETLQELIGQQ